MLLCFWASYIRIPDPLVRGKDPDPSTIKQKLWVKPDFYCFVTSLWLFILSADLDPKKMSRIHNTGTSTNKIRLGPEQCCDFCECRLLNLDSNPDFLHPRIAISILWQTSNFHVKHSALLRDFQNHKQSSIFLPLGWGGGTVCLALLDFSHILVHVMKRY